VTRQEGISRVAEALMNEFTVVVGAVDFRTWAPRRLKDFDPGLPLHEIWEEMCRRLIIYVPAESRPLIEGFLASSDPATYLAQAFEQNGDGHLESCAKFVAGVQLLIDDAVSAAVMHGGREAALNA